MRKLFLILSIGFVVYYGASLWLFTAPDSYRVVSNYLPLALLIGVFIIGLVHIRFALGLAVTLILLGGQPAFLNEFVTKVLHAPASCAIFDKFGTPVESILLGLFAAWVLIRFFGNPELDYEVSRANAARALHFAVGVFGLMTVLAGAYAVLQTANIFFISVRQQAQATLVTHPFPFLSGAGPLGPLRATIQLLEVIGIYTITINEVRSVRQIRTYLGLLLVLGLVLVGLGWMQQSRDLAYGSALWKYNKEVHATIADPNSFAVILLALLPLCASLLTRGPVRGLIGMLCAAILITGIALSDTKAAIAFAAIYLIVILVVMIVRMAKRGAVWPVVMSCALVVVLAAGYGSVKLAVGSSSEKDTPGAPKGRADALVKKVDGTIKGIFGGGWSLAALNQRTNFKSGDWLTALNMLNPAGQHAAERLICGVGLGRFGVKFDAFRSSAAGRGREGASNMLLHAGAEMGVFGLLALLLIVAFAAARALSAGQQVEQVLFMRALGWSLLLLALGCMTENAFLRPQVQVVFWLLVGLCMVAYSLAPGETAAGGGTMLKTLAILLILAAWCFVIYTPAEGQRQEALTVKELAERYAGLYNLEAPKLRQSLERTRDYGMNNIYGERWTEESSLIMTRVTGPVFRCTVSFVNPDVSTSNPLKATLSIDGETIKDVTFTNGEELGFLRRGSEDVEVDISKNPALEQHVGQEDNVLVRVHVNRVWVPANYTNVLAHITNTLGVAVTPIQWQRELTPPAPPTPSAPEIEPQESAPQAGASAAAPTPAAADAPKGEEAAPTPAAAP